jgi:mitosis inhibitor protein kinase SWE1
MVDLITRCMRAEPSERPAMTDIVTHPIVDRARRLGKDALAPEDDFWLPRVLADASPSAISPPLEDVEMAD